MQHIKGIGVSSGVSIGKAEVILPEEIAVEHKKIQDPEREWQRLQIAREEACRQIKEIYEQTLEKIGEEEAEIFDAHLSMMQDKEFFDPVENLIKEEKRNAEWAVEEVRDRFIGMFQEMDNTYMQQRALDIKDISCRLLRILSGEDSDELSSDRSIIVSADLTPSDTAQLDKEKVLGFIMETGGKTSHSAIIARTLGIPAVVGVKGILDRVKDDDQLILDGDSGEIYVNPDQQMVKRYQQKRELYLQSQQKYQQVKDGKPITRDGYYITLAANIGLIEDLDNVMENDAEGIGLFRTEFLYMGRSDFPTEEEQFTAYKTVAEKMQGKPVIIRTLDIGGDKDLPYFEFPRENNPFLGLRAIRLCLDRIKLFKTQLRAILRASSCGNIKIMFPMIATVPELLQARALLDEAREELQTAGIPYDEDIEVGMMMETPAAAVIAAKFAKLVDFFSIGTNDLIQYTTAVDRMNAKVASLYSPFNPSVLRLVKQIIEAAHQEGICVSICGEAARIPALVPYFAALGIDELSMTSGSILEIKWILQQLELDKMKELIPEVEEKDSAVEIRDLLEKNLAEIIE